MSMRTFRSVNNGDKCKDIWIENERENL